MRVSLPSLLVALGLLGCAPTASKPAAGEDTGGAAPTWYADVAPLLTGSCVGCHAPGGIAPFALDTYESASAMAQAIAASVEDGSMPPFDAVETDSCQPRLGWKNDIRLSAEARATLRAWADAGAPEGDPATATALPSPVDVTLPDATQRAAPAVGFAASGQEDEFMCVSVDPGLVTDRWLTGWQIVPGNTDVVHHVLVFTDPEAETASWGDSWQTCFNVPQVSGEQLIGAWAPGGPPFLMPADAGIPITAGTRLIFQIHYHPRGADAAEDLTAMDLRWTDTAPRWNAGIVLVGNASNEDQGLLSGPDDSRPNFPEFDIPADVADHTETMAFPLGRGTGDLRLFAVATHMHYIGTDMQIRVQRPDTTHGPEDECLLETTWDFNWQRTYSYDAEVDDLPVASTGDTLWMQCRYDNTLDNPGTRQALEDAGLTAPVDVTLGETTLDEMCLGAFGYLYEP